MYYETNERRLPLRRVGPGCLFLDSSERGLERGPDHPLESPASVLRVILQLAQRPTISKEVREPLANS